MRTLAFLLLSFLYYKTHAQNQISFSLSGSCSYYGESISNNVYGFSSSQEAENIIEVILSQVGLKKNFQINAANVPNAAAVINGTTRHILYSQNFISQINILTNSKWASISILAHEIGHHLNGHTLEAGGSRPSIELESDEFSGFVLARMGASLAEAQLVMQSLNPNQASTTHPSKSARLEAIAVGWYKAKENALGTTTNNTSKNPPVIQTSPTNNVSYVSKCLFDNDPVAYYITNTNLIVRYNPSNNKMEVIGQKQPSKDSRYAWIFATRDKLYGVDTEGSIWGYNRWGMHTKIGLVTYP